MVMRIQLRKKEKAFIIIGLMLFCILVVFLLIDLSGTNGIHADNRDGIGRVLYLYNDVSRRATSSETGEVLYQGDPVLRGDTVVSGPESSAGIALRDGTLVDMCEDSVISFTTGDNDVVIAVEKGCADVKRSGREQEAKTGLVIVAENRRISLNRGDLTIAAPQGGDPEVYVREGKAKVFVNGEEKTISADERAVLQSDTMSVEKKRLVLVDPVENRQFYMKNEKDKIEFAWEYRGDREKSRDFLVDISGNREFAPVHRRVQSSDEMIAISLPDGNYFWRVSLKNPENGMREVSETRRFAVFRDSAFALLSPSDGEQLEYKIDPPLIMFTWEPHKLAGAYRLEISDRRDFSRLVKNIDSRVVNFSWQWERDRDAGQATELYWRVTATGGPKGWPGRRSEVRRLTVKRVDRLRPPRLVYPPDGTSMSRARVDREHLIFSWEKTEDTLTRRLAFSKDRDFSTVYREAPVDADHWDMQKSFPTGKYFWRVGLYDDSNKRVAISGVRLFELRDYEDLLLLSPRDRADYVVTDLEKKGLAFKWKNPELRGRYVLELSGDRDFTRVERTVRTASARAALDGVQPGDFYWRVKMMSDDNVLAALSETRRLTVREGIAPPVVLFPKSGGAVRMLTENELKFAWKPVRGANAYQLELHQLIREKQKTQDRLVLSTQTKESNYTVSDLSMLDVGNFYWTIRAVKKNRRNKVVRSSRKVRNNFNINLGDSRIIIVSPEIQVIEKDND
ncbi:MAG: hypothetical protein JXA07_11105 [Spirochaetes bacterium]|nr:hypothetical protein [Spirochaetota bacterium]